MQKILFQKLIFWDTKKYIFLFLAVFLLSSYIHVPPKHGFAICRHFCLLFDTRVALIAQKTHKHFFNTSSIKKDCRSLAFEKIMQVQSLTKVWLTKYFPLSTSRFVAVDGAFCFILLPAHLLALFSCLFTVPNLLCLSKSLRQPNFVVANFSFL